MSLLTLLPIFGGLALFMYGMKLLSESLEQATGDNLRKILSSVTSNRFFGICTGAFVTAILQSSAAIVVMVISFVNAGLIQQFQAISIIIGANIGTTITGWLVSLTNSNLKIINIMSVAYLATIAGMICIFIKKKKVNMWGLCLIGFGLLFIGLDMLQKSIPVPNIEAGEENWIYSLCQFFSGDGSRSVSNYFKLYIFILVGLLITCVFQSSSVTMAITITLVHSSYMGLYAGAAMVIGENVGSTVTAVIASLAGNKNAKKTASAHVLIKVIGSIWLIMPFIFYPFVDLCSKCFASQAMQLSLFHTLFNVINTFLIVWFIKPIVKLIDRIFGTSDEDQSQVALFTSSAGLIRTPDAALVEVRNELTKMSNYTIESYDHVCDILRKPNANNSKTIERVYEIENLIDKYESEIYQFLIKVLGETSQGKTIERINSMLEEIRLYEWISDSCEKIAKLYKKSRENDYNFEEFDKNIDKILKETNNLVNVVRFNINNLKDNNIFIKTLEIEDKINSLYKKNKKKVVVDMKKNTTKENVAAGICVLDIIREMEHIADNFKNIIKIHNTQQI